MEAKVSNVKVGSWIRHKAVGTIGEVKGFEKVLINEVWIDVLKVWIPAEYKFMQLPIELLDGFDVGVVDCDGLWYDVVEKSTMECKDCPYAESYFMNGSYDHYKCTHAGGEVCKYEEDAKAEVCEYCGKETFDYVYAADDCPICKECDEYLSGLPLEVGVF